MVDADHEDAVKMVASLGRVVLVVVVVTMDNVKIIEQGNLPKIMVNLASKVEIKITGKIGERKSYVVHGIYTHVMDNLFVNVDYVYRAN